MASDDELDSGLLGISLSISDSEETEKPRTRAEKNAQSEEDFQTLRAVYTVKVEDGEVWKTVQLPLEDAVSKQQAQELLHAVEELYFFRRYTEGADFVLSLLGDDHAERIDEDTRELLGYYGRRCTEKVGR